MSFQLSPDQITKNCKTEQEALSQKIDAITKIPHEKATFSNTVLVLETVLTEASNNIQNALFLKYVSDDKAIRDSSDQCEQSYSQFYVDLYTKEDLFSVIKSAHSKGEKLDKIEQKLIDDYLDNFKRNGLDLSPEQRKIFIKKKKQLVKLESEFSTNVNEWKDETLFTKEELEGMPEDFVSSLEQKDGKFVVTLSYPHYFGVMKNAKKPEVRKQLQEKFFKRGGEENKNRLEQAIEIRYELAKMLDYSSHAEFVLKKRMAQKPETVKNFLNNLITQLTPIGEQNLAELLVLKKLEEGESATKIEPWDWRYYENQLKIKNHQIDHQQIKEYFPLEVVNQGMFNIYQKLLDVTFVEDSGADKWHDSVLAYQVIDNKKQEPVALFYMDLFPREGKYKHAAAFTLTQGYLKADGSYQKPVSSIVANYNPPAAGKPSLLTHNQVETQFHEFGHIMHQVLTKARFASQSGTSVKRDFVEAPSQMLENWTWKKQGLELMSGHYETGEKLPETTIQRLLGAKRVNSGIFYLRQAFFATLDLTYHTATEACDTTEIYSDLMKKIMLIDMPENTYPQASFGHLMGGYDAGYYGYLWSEVFAQDMFTRFEGHLLSPKVGTEYRKWILEKGSELEPLELIENFLGRPYSQEAFFESLGIKPATKKTKSKEEAA